MRRSTNPQGLLAAGGDLSPERLMAAYRRGIFPWYLARAAGAVVVARSARGAVPARIPLLAQPREDPAQRRASKSSFDQAFASVISNLRRARRPGPGTWITPEMQAAYVELHGSGHAHSVEVRMRRASWSAGSTGCASGAGVLRRIDVQPGAPMRPRLRWPRWSERCAVARDRADRLPDALAPPAQPRAAAAVPRARVPATGSALRPSLR